MKTCLLGVLFATIVGPLAAAEETALPLAEPWETAYGGDDAKGKRVIALWEFTPGEEARDASGHGHGLKLEGVKTAADGRFGGCLESFAAEGSCGERRHAAIARSMPDLSPKGPFTLELWIKPKPELAGSGKAFLMDKKYVAHDDYQLVLGPADLFGAAGIAGEPGVRRRFGHLVLANAYRFSRARGITWPSSTTARGRGRFISTARRKARRPSPAASRSVPARICSRSAIASAVATTAFPAGSTRSASAARRWSSAA